jgi:hypothetical protein
MLRLGLSEFAPLTDVFFVAINKVIATFCYGRGGYFLLS